eukprot:TRINITY_DN10044_c0_g1_i3.p1 TRINITY_DN10044_c0_g1~~TRINITY_DN10044_c0_g1_i3.p1  ORF type:complete len:313 (+),score=-0.10 TRINITY_DN10044_c0_g1_i3:105-1043(+)
MQLFESKYEMSPCLVLGLLLAVCIAKPDRCTLIVSEPRSGSTALAQAFMTFPSTFATLEPYHHWSRHPTEQDSTPNLNQLFSCRVWSADTSRKLLSNYACLRGRLFGCQPAKVNHPVCWRCRTGQLRSYEAKQLHRRCQQSRHILIKTVRPSMVKNWTIAETSCRKTVIIHLVRDPWLVVKSVHSRGWLRKPDNNVSSELQRLGGHYCRSLYNTARLLESITPSDTVKVLTIKHTHLLSQPAVTTDTLLLAHGLPATSGLASTFLHKLQDPGAGDVGVAIHRHEVEHITPELGRKLLRRRWFCQKVYETIEF